MEGGESFVHLPLHFVQEAVCVRGQLESGIIRGPFALEIVWQVLFGVAVAIGSFDPDLFGTQAFPQCEQDANLIGETVDSIAAFAFLQNSLPATGRARFRREGPALRTDRPAAGCRAYFFTIASVSRTGR